MSLIQSIGPPPERHADRIIGEMMRKLAHDRAQLWDGVAKVFYSSGWSGGVRAQRRMAQRMADIPGVAGCLRH